MTSGVYVFFFLVALRFSVILFGYIKCFQRLSWSLSWWEVRDVLRGESLPGLEAAFAPSSHYRRVSGPWCSPDCVPVVSAWQERGSKLRQIWKADSCFQTARDGYSQPSWAWTCAWRGRCQWGTVQAAFVRRGFHTNVLCSYALTYK